MQVSKCTYPWAGQLGDCGKWLRFKELEEAFSRGRLLLSSYNNGFLVVSGESSGAYHSSLQLDTVYRALILLDEEFAVVVDSIKTKETSSISKVTTLFNNAINSFLPYSKKTDSRTFNGFQMVKDGRQYFAFGITNEGLSPEPNITTLHYKSLAQMIAVSNGNITLPILDNHSLAAFLFHSSHINIQGVDLVQTENSTILAVNVSKSGLHYHFSIQIDSNFQNIRVRRTHPHSSYFLKDTFPFYVFTVLVALAILRHTFKVLLSCFFWKILNRRMVS